MQLKCYELDSLPWMHDSIVCSGQHLSQEANQAIADVIHVQDC